MTSDSNVSRQECETCGGPLQADKTGSGYVCVYCGNHYQRQ
ncbi:hypothetical protein [Bifidobacterium vansinderenii]|uniref:Uncharacterized protein n=1 Tax=Bifidobacterium vansinderenii TaxID=1984871 RepID=A0A229VWN6_9BIFI|nr:hypothetical protein [Bifidobacterium vansinderenii]OXN00041.1 hypothetical protein Tam10B_1737 [Bifidobacterium vansinderenii]